MSLPHEIRIEILKNMTLPCAAAGTVAAIAGIGPSEGLFFDLSHMRPKAPDYFTEMLEIAEEAFDEEFLRKHFLNFEFAAKTAVERRKAYQDLAAHCIGGVTGSDANRRELYPCVQAMTFDAWGESVE